MYQLISLQSHAGFELVTNNDENENSTKSSTNVNSITYQCNKDGTWNRPPPLCERNITSHHIIAEHNTLRTEACPHTRIQCRSIHLHHVSFPEFLSVLCMCQLCRVLLLNCDLNCRWSTFKMELIIQLQLLGMDMCSLDGCSYEIR